MRQIWESDNMGFTPKSVFKINQLKSCLFKYKSVICFVPAQKQLLSAAVHQVKDSVHSNSIYVPCQSHTAPAF